MDKQSNKSTPSQANSKEAK